MALDHCRLGLENEFLENKSGRIFCVRQVYLDQGVQAGPWPQGLNVAQILLVLNINLVNKCIVLVHISQLVRYPTIQSSDCKRDSKPVM